MRRTRDLIKMPDMDCLETDVVDMSSRLSAAIAFKWEAAPGKPISEATAAIPEPCRTPIRPPPGGRSTSNSFVESRSTFEGFAPEMEIPRPAAPVLAGKIFKKLVKLRKKSSSATACFPLDAFRYLSERREVHSSDVDVERCYDSDEYSGYSTSTFDQPDTPSSSCSSLGSKSSGSISTSRYAPPTPQRAHQLMSNMLLSLPNMDDNDGEDNDDSDEGDSMHGPRESAWHQPEDQEWQMVRRGRLHARSSMLSTLIVQGSRNVDHCVKYLTVGGSAKRSSTLPRIDLH